MITSMPIAAGADITPAFMLTLGGDDITDNLSNRLLSLTMTDNRGFEASSMTATGNSLCLLAARCCHCFSAGKGRR